MKIRRRYIILMVLFVLYLGIRLYFSLQTPYFTNEESYYALRQIEHIKKVGLPLTKDTLSYGGRTFILLPVYYYLLAFFSWIFPGVFTLKIVNNILASTIIVAVYLLAKRIIKNRKISIIVATVSALLPIYINQTINDLSIYSLIFPGTFFLLYFFISLEKDEKMLQYIIPLTLFLTLATSAIFLLLFGLIILLLLRYIEKVPSSRINLEYISFFTFFFLWTNFIIYKSAFQLHGFDIIWKNTPTQILSQYFVNINLLQAIYNIGLLPFVFGMFSLYNYIMRKKSKNLLVFISLFLSTLIIFWLKMVQAELALIFMGSSLVILFGQFLRDFFSGLRKTKFAKYENSVFILVIVLLILTQVLPGIFSMSHQIKNTPTEEYIESFRFLKSTPKNSVILGTPEEGHLITYFGERKNVLDTDYLLIQDVDVRVDDIKKAYTQKFRIEALRLLEKYEVDYIVFSKKAREKYDIESISYINDECFSLILNDTTKIYRRDRTC